MGSKPLNNNNILSIYESLEAKELNLSSSEYVAVRARLRGQSLNYSEENLFNSFKSIPKGRVLATKIKNTRYNWLFDDLQRFTATDLKNLSKEELTQELKQIFPEAIKDKAVQRVANGLFNNRLEVSKRVLKPTIERLSSRRVPTFERFIKEERREVFNSLVTKNQVIKRDSSFLVQKTDRRGRDFFYDFANGRRAKNPFK